MKKKHVISLIATLILGVASVVAAMLSSTTIENEPKISIEGDKVEQEVNVEASTGNMETGNALSRSVPDQPSASTERVEKVNKSMHERHARELDRLNAEGDHLRTAYLREGKMIMKDSVIAWGKRCASHLAIARQGSYADLPDLSKVPGGGDYLGPIEMIQRVLTTTAATIRQ